MPSGLNAIRERDRARVRSPDRSALRTRRSPPNRRRRERSGSHVHAMRAPRVRQQLLVDAAEPAVRHEHHEVAGRCSSTTVVTISSIERLSRASTGRAVADRAPAARPTAARSSGSVERNTGATARRRRRANARAKSSWKMRRHDDAERGSKTAQIAASGIGRAHAGQRLGNRGRMMREVVVDRDAVGDADDLQPALDAAERPQPFGDRVGARARLRVADGDRGQRVADVVGAEQRHLERAERRPAAPHPEPSSTSGAASRSCACQSTPSASAERLDRATARAREPAPRVGLSAPSSSRPRRGTRLTSRRNASRIASMSG